MKIKKQRIKRIPVVIFTNISIPANTPVEINKMPETEIRFFCTGETEKRKNIKPDEINNRMAEIWLQESDWGPKEYPANVPIEMKEKNKMNGK